MGAELTMTTAQSTSVAGRISMVAPAPELGFNKLYRDFLAGADSVSSLYPNQNPLDLAELLATQMYDRDAIAEILLEQNKRYGAKNQALTNIERLRDPRSLVVFSGQQAGLFGGPLLGLYKALWAVKRAAALEAQLDRPVIPIFWIAADDHDFDEINHCYVYDALGEPQTLRYYESSNPGEPAYNQRFNSKEILDEICSGLKDSLGETDFTPELLERLFAAYSEGESFVEAFGKFFCDTIPDIGLALFSPGDEKIKALSKPFYHSLLDNYAEVKSALAVRNAVLTKRGYHLQVEKNSSACHIFMLNPERSAIHFDGGKFTVGQSEFTRAELDALIDNEPERFSPDVISRPLMAAYLFPTIEQSGGPAEVAYFAQLAPLYQILELNAPVFSGRISATLLEKRFERLLEKNKLSFSDFTGDVESVINEVLGRTFPVDLEKQFAEIRADFSERFRELTSDVAAFDKSLEANAGQVWGKIEHSLNAFEKKTFASHKRKLADERAAIYRAANALFPNGALQERSLSMIYYLSRYGYGLIDFIVEALEPETAAHQVVHLSLYANKESDKK